MLLLLLIMCIDIKIRHIALHDRNFLFYIPENKFINTLKVNVTKEGREETVLMLREGRKCEQKRISESRESALFPSESADQAMRDQTQLKAALKIVRIVRMARETTDEAKKKRVAESVRRNVHK